MLKYKTKPSKQTGITVRHPLAYKSWIQMRSRCLNKNHHAYARYGGRGIGICERWNDFTNFLQDLGDRPSTDYSLDRIDNEQGYDPSNCRWATASEQAVNRRLFGNNKSGYRGVQWKPEYQRWQSQIMVDYRAIYIASCTSAEEAAWMYDQWALELHGGLAQLNFEYV
jgi:hypothetical protein